MALHGELGAQRVPVRRIKGFSHQSQLRAQARARGSKVRTDAVTYLRGDLARRKEVHLVNIQLVRNQLPVPSHSLGELLAREHHIRPQERLAHLQPAVGSNFQAERDQPSNRCHFDCEIFVDLCRIHGRIAGEMNAFWLGARPRPPHEVLVHLLREERDKRGNQSRGHDQGLVEREVGVELVRLQARCPIPGSAAADVPVREAFDEGQQPLRGVIREVVIERGGHIAHGKLNLSENPPVKKRAFGDRAVPLAVLQDLPDWSFRALVTGGGVEAIDIRVDGEKRIDVSELYLEVLLEHPHVAE